jgi:hypothetical protein
MQSSFKIFTEEFETMEMPNGHIQIHNLSSTGVI